MGEKRSCSISVQACGSRIFWLAFCLDLFVDFGRHLCVEVYIPFQESLNYLSK